tara:strand:- start:2144 stop:2719 length:576 start_codon:yes stop_codon:yes gene_type:complete
MNTVYTLRHEKRPLANTFFVSLTEMGKAGAQELGHTLEHANIDIIFCSPFLRTIQTILPYCIRTNTKINVEYSVYEYIHQDCFTIDNYSHSHYELYTTHPQIEHYVNADYNSFTQLSDIVYNEQISNVLDRVIPFITHLESYAGKNILIVAHGTILGVINKYITQGMLYTTEDELAQNYPKMGVIQKLDPI